MGAKGVRIPAGQAEMNQFTRFLLKDMQALEKMLDLNWFESDSMKIGAEQEICLIDEHGKPAPKSVEILEKINHPSFTTELARFNLEANLEPLPFTGDCFSKTEDTIKALLNHLQLVALECDAMPLLTGILPTIRKFDLELNNLTPIDRYYALIDSITQSRGNSFDLKIEGLDELNIRQSSAMIEACNTSYQVHLQIKPEEFVQKYNIAQAIAAPILAISTNSPMLFGKRLWSETRIALFQQSVDTRITGEHLRYTSPRVTFGTGWVKDSILDLYKEDIIRFKPLLVTDIEEDVLECIEKGITPKLKALSIHNSTVYRWNRPCYGISPNGKPHMRIENRILPAGPTVTDEVANSAFWIGLMNGFGDVYPDVTKLLDFDDAKSNFLIAARAGLGNRFQWLNNSTVNDTELIEKELIPIAKEGLKKANVNAEDIDKYLGVIEERNKSCQTGSRWMLNSYSKLIKETSKEEATTALVAGISRNQMSGEPVHRWPLASINDIADWEPSSLLVEEFMTTDIFTVNKDDIPEFSADMMSWKSVRYMPIENKEGELIGLITMKDLLKYFVNLHKDPTQSDDSLMEDLMIKNPLTISPEATIVEAMEMMQKTDTGCLPVVTNKKLVGIITEGNFIKISASLLKRFAARRKKIKKILASLEAKNEE